MNMWWHWTKGLALPLIRSLALARLRASNPTLRVESPSIFRWDDLSALKLGEGVHIGAFSEIVVFRAHPLSKTSGGLHVGHRAVIGTGANIRAAGGLIRIGESALLAQNVSLIAANHSLSEDMPYRDAPWDDTRTGIDIGNNAWLGAGVIVLPGVSIGANAVVAAGAVVTHDVPAGEVWGGIPARFIRRAKP